MLLRSTFFLFLFLACDELIGVPVERLPQGIRQACRHFKQKHRLPGLAVAIYYQGKPYFLNFGFSHPGRRIRVTKNTLFDIASITKVFVSTALAVQVSRNRMQLSDPLLLHFPFLRNHPSAPVGHFTLEQLATHTSGLPREAKIRRQTKRRVLRSLLRWYPASPRFYISLFKLGL